MQETVINGFDTARSLCFKYFDEIRKIPRPSFHEEKIADYLVEFARDRGLWVHRDAVHNVIIKRPGSPGRENDPPLIVQSHTDMVCQKEPDSTHDFMKDPIDIYVDEKGMLRARGTTLGADCGSGVSMMLGLLDEPDLSCPPLECVFTVQEEDGMGGAKALDFSLLSGKRMIGTDGNHEGTTMFSASGVICDQLCRTLGPDSGAGAQPAYRLDVSGLTSGHGGINIGMQQANAIKVCGRLLHHLNKRLGIRLVSLEGGRLMHTIPRDCTAVFTVSQAVSPAQVADAVKELAEQVKAEYLRTDPALEVTCAPAGTAAPTQQADSDAVIGLVYLLPVGARSRTPEILERVEGSLNLSIAGTDQGKVALDVVCRANYPANIQELDSQLRAFADTFGMTCEETASYAGHWVPEDSPMTQVWEKVYRKHTGQELRRVFGHCGLDAGTIYDGMNTLDLIVVVPDIQEVHTTQENVDLESMYRTYEYIKEIVATC